MSAGDDDVLHVFDTAEGRHVAAIPSSKYGCQNVVWTHAPDKVVFASNKVGRWELQQRQSLDSLCPAGSISSLPSHQQY